MTELNQVFDGDLAERAFLIVSVIFVVLYACGILLMQRTEAKARRTAFYGKTAVTALFLTVAAGVGKFTAYENENDRYGGKPARQAISLVANGLLFSSSGAVNNPVSVSIVELQSTVDMKSLPEQQVESLF